MKKYLRLFKMTRDTNLFKKGQKVWFSYSYGCGSAVVFGRYQGNGKWINAIIRPIYLNGYEGGNGKPNAIEIGEVEIKGYFKKLLFIWDLNKKYGSKIKVTDLEFLNLRETIKLLKIKKEIEKEFNTKLRKIRIIINDKLFSARQKILNRGIENIVKQDRSVSEWKKIFAGKKKYKRF